MQTKRAREEEERALSFIRRDSPGAGRSKAGGYKPRVQPHGQAKQETWNREVGQNQIKTVQHKQGSFDVPQTGSPLFSQMEQEATPESQGKASLKPKDSKCPLCLSRGRVSSRILSRNDNTAVLHGTMSLCPGLIQGLYLWCSCHYSPHLQMKKWKFPEAHLPVVAQPVSDSARRWDITRSILSPTQGRHFRGRGLQTLSFCRFTSHLIANVSM